jgi:hypothetical protein
MPIEARAYPRPLPNSEWLGKLTEEILKPDLPIVDPHHHLWDHPGSHYLLDELLADMGSGHNIVATPVRGNAPDRRKQVRPGDCRGGRSARRQDQDLRRHRPGASHARRTVKLPLSIVKIPFWLPGRWDIGHPDGRSLLMTR